MVERVPGRPQLSSHPGLVFTGNYFSGVSTQACIQQASDAARRVEHYLASSRGRGRRERQAARAAA